MKPEDPMAQDPTRWIERNLARTARRVARAPKGTGGSPHGPRLGKMTPLSWVFLIVIIAVALGALALTRQAQDLPGSPGELQEAVVERVVDGDTLKVSVDGQSERIRLIGIDTPESVAPQADRNSEEGDEASAHTKSLVHVGQTVYLETDAEDVDRYDRKLRYVWLEVPEDRSDRDEVATKMLNGVIVSDGYAKARDYAPNTAHSEALHALQAEAEDAGRGLWADGDWE